jgi:predicted tellurium resistance membrane protein TerC
MNKDIIARILFWTGWSMILTWYIRIFNNNQLITLPVFIIIMMTLIYSFYFRQDYKEEIER